MIDRKLLLSDLQKQVWNLEEDLREQVEPVDEVPLRLRGEYDRARGQAHRRHLGGVARGASHPRRCSRMLNARVAVSLNWTAALTNGRRSDAGVGTTGNDGCQFGEGKPRDH